MHTNFTLSWQLVAVREAVLKSSISAYMFVSLEGPQPASCSQWRYPSAALCDSGLLLGEGGSYMHIQNLVGVSPLQVCPSDMAALITRFDNEFGLVISCCHKHNQTHITPLYSGKVFHGSLKRSPPSTTRVQQHFPQAVSGL